MADSGITKKALAGAMKRLMAEKGFDRISISDICDACFMNRKSFYYHFRDKYDLVNWIFYTEFLEVMLAGEAGRDGWALLLEAFRYFGTEKGFYRAALRISGQNCFRDYFEEVTLPVIMGLSGGLSVNRVYLRIVSRTMLVALEVWLEDGGEMTAEELLRGFRREFANSRIKD